MNEDICPLCKSTATRLFNTTKNRVYYLCGNCFGIHLRERDRLSPAEEKERYLHHHNDINDEGSRAFVSPIVNSILARHGPADRGLDFGAGPGPVIAAMLREREFNIQLYDPFFHDDAETLNHTYDYIVCCEVIEHFYDPHKEFQTLKNLLNAGGILYCMTHLYQENLRFESWYYKEDPTHVFFYQDRTMRWIKDRFGFARVEVDNRLILFQK